MEELHEEFGDDFCGVVVCAGGLKRQWADAIAQFTGGTQDAKGKWHGGAPTIVVEGTPAKRMDLYETALEQSPRYVIVGYDQVVDDNSMVAKLPQMFVACDEVTTIKNPTAVVTQAVRATFGEAPFRWGLTGTPMENGRPEEMFQLMVWVDDSVLGRADLFDKTFVKRNRYGRPVDYINIPLFHKMMEECSVNISLDDPEVAKYMPAVGRQKRVLVELDRASALVYHRMSDDLLAELAEAAKKVRGSFDLFAHYAGDSAEGQTQGRIMSRISCMRMLCAHPSQLVESGEQYLAAAEVREKLERAQEEHEGRHGVHSEEECDAPPHAAGWPKVKKRVSGKEIWVDKPLDGSAYAGQLLDEGVLDDLEETPKADALEEDILAVLGGTCSCCGDVEAPEVTSKVVVFSYHKLLLRVLQRRLGAVSTRYDGDMTPKAREASKEVFQRDPAVRVFLTSDAGGYGVDLPQANHLFNADVPFTAGRVTQRNARVRRANLDHHSVVHVRDYLVDGSLEEFYAEVTSAKNKMATAVRTGRGHNKGKLAVNAATLGAFLTENSV